MALRLLRSNDEEERLRGLQRAAATRTPEALSLLERASQGALPGASVDGAARQDPRALLVVVRGLASWIDKPSARAALEALLSDSAQISTTRVTPSVGRDPVDETQNAARMVLAWHEAAMALAESGTAPALEALVKAARSSGPGQVAALDALAVYPPTNGLLVGGVLLTTPAMVRLAAEVGDLRSLSTILGSAQTAEPGMRAAAIAALGLMGDARALEIAREAAKHKDPRVRVAAAEALGRLGAPDAAQAVEALVGDDATARDGLRIARSVGSMGVTRAAAARAVASADPEVRALAIVALGRQPGAEAVGALVTLAGDALLAGDAMDALARSPCSAAMAAIERLAAAPTTRRLAARAYFVRRTVRGERSARGDALLAALAASGDGADRALGVEALVALGERGLERELEDRDPRVRRAAAMGSMALRRTVDAPAVVGQLTAHLAVETDDPTRRVMAVGLVEGDPSGAIPTMTLLDRAEAGGADAPLAALALARRADEQVTPKVEALLASHDPVMRAHVARGLGASTAPDAGGRLAQAYLWEPVVEVRRALIEALATRSTDERRAPSLRQALDLASRLDPDRVTREAAARALDGRDPAGKRPAREIAWLRVVPAEGARLPRDLTGALIDSDGIALPVAFDEDGYALVPGLPPGDAHLRLTPRLPEYGPR